MKFISYYTEGVYETVMKNYLLPTLKDWNLDYDIKAIKDLGNWGANSHYKAKLIKEMLLKHKQPLVFTDADSTIEQPPILFNKLRIYSSYIDIALHFLDWWKFWKKIEGQERREALSGTLYLNYNEAIFQFLDEWIKENNKNPSTVEQKNMQNVLEKQKNKLQIEELPSEYCCILLKDGTIPRHYIVDKPVIVHHQVSRQFRRRKI